jgi:CRISPR-associated protein Csb2
MMPSAGSMLFWSWRLEPAGPTLGMAPPLGYALRAAVLQAAAGVGLDRLSDSLHNSGPEGGHRHAHWLSEDRDRDGAIDHVTVYAESGIGANDARALQATSGLRLEQAEFRLLPAEAGARRAGGLFGPATMWTAATPFVTRLWRLTKTGKPRAGFTASAQVVREIGELENCDRERRLPDPVGVAWLPVAAVGDGLATAADFVLAADGARPNGDAVAGFPLVAFAEPVAGPIAIGYGAHFGLGLLVPADTEPRIES